MITNINEHLKEIYSSKELTLDSTIRNFRIVQNEGDRQVARSLNFYNLDAIISVGYRVNSLQAHGDLEINFIMPLAIHPIQELKIEDRK